MSSGNSETFSNGARSSGKLRALGAVLDYQKNDRTRPSHATGIVVRVRHCQPTGICEDMPRSAVLKCTTLCGRGFAALSGVCCVAINAIIISGGGGTSMYRARNLTVACHEKPVLRVAIAAGYVLCTGSASSRRPSPHALRYHAKVSSWFGGSNCS